MTHHNTISTKDLLDRVRSSRRSFENTRCNWCQTEANYWTSLGEDNFVPIEGKVLDGKQAYAVFCPNCLKDPAKKEEVKYAFTIDQTVGEDFVPSQTPFREIRDYEDARAGPDEGLTAEEAAKNTQPSTPTPEKEGKAMVTGRADAETGTRVVDAEKAEDPKKKKGLFG